MQKLKGNKGRMGACHLLSVLVVTYLFSMPCFMHQCIQRWLSISFFLQLSAIDVSARTTMKGAAKCDKHCELQNSVNQQGLERTLCFRDMPESMPTSVSIASDSGDTSLPGRVTCVCLCVRASSWQTPLTHSEHGAAARRTTIQHPGCYLLYLVSEMALTFSLSETPLQDMKLGQQTR